MGSKAARQVPNVLLKWLAKNVSPEFADWYAKNSRSGARQITGERQHMSKEAGTTGAYHEGHFRGAKDVDPVLGGGPTTGLTMRPEIGAVNVAHKELPRIPYEAMVEAGIPQNWIEDVFETVLVSEGLGVIGNFDTQAALDMDYGDVTPGQAMAQTDRRQQLRAQGVRQVGPDTSVRFKPFQGDIQVNPDAELPNLTEGLAQQLEREQKQIANRRSSRTLDELRNQTNAIMTGYQPTALGGFVFGEQNNQQSMPQTPYTPPTLGGYVHRNVGPWETPPVDSGGENLAQQIFSAENMENASNALQTGAAVLTGGAAVVFSTLRDAVFGFGSGL